MKVDVSNTSSTELTLNVHLEWEEVSNIYQRTMNELRKDFVMDGFRPGKVPMPIFERHNEGKIKYDFSNEVIDSTKVKALEENGISEYLDLSLKTLDFDEGKPFVYSLIVEVDPKIELPDYKKGFEVVKRTYVIVPEDVESRLEEIRESNAEVRTVTDGAQMGHFIICDLQELDRTGVPLIGRKITQRVIKVGEGIFGEDGAGDLIGAKAGDKIMIHTKNDRGDETKFEVTVHDVESHTLPELTNDYIKENFKDVNNIDELKVLIEKQLQNEWDKRSQSEFYAAMSEYLLSNTSIDVPSVRLNAYLKAVFDDVKSRNSGKEIDEELLKEQYTKFAKREIRWFLLRREIIRAENLKVENEEFEERLRKIAENFKEKERGSIYKYYRKPENRRKIEDDLYEKKVFDFLSRYVKVKKETIRTSELRNRNVL